jgi:hypothetical protein
MLRGFDSIWPEGGLRQIVDIFSTPPTALGRDDGAGV